MKNRFLTPVIALLVTVSSACVITSDGDDASLTIRNASSETIYELYMSEVDRETYGPDLLGSDVLVPGESVRIYVDCDHYDVLLVDEDGMECRLNNLYLCFEDAVWVLDDGELASCTW